MSDVTPGDANPKAIEYWREHSNNDASPDWTQFPLDVRHKLDSISVEILSCAFAAEEMRGELFDAKYLERNVRWNRAMVMIAELLRVGGPPARSVEGQDYSGLRLPDDFRITVCATCKRAVTDHKYVAPECDASGCHYLFLKELRERGEAHIASWAVNSASKPHIETMKKLMAAMFPAPPSVPAGPQEEKK